MFFVNRNYTEEIETDEDRDEVVVAQNCKTIHTNIVDRYLRSRAPNRLLNSIPPSVDSFEEDLARDKRRTLAQLRTNKSPFIKTYLNHIDPDSNPSDLCPLCGIGQHDTVHLFNCTHMPTALTPTDLWRHRRCWMSGRRSLPLRD